MIIKILGTSHISKESVRKIKREIEENLPDIVAVELDMNRARALTSKQKRKIGLREIRYIGLKGFIFAKIGQYVQEKLGEMVGVKPGSEMKMALATAHKHKLKIMLIDQPIEITLRNFSKRLTWTERWRFVVDIFNGVFRRKKVVSDLGFDMNFDLSKVPEDELIDKMIEHVEKRYPSIYKTIIADRNVYMVKKLKALREKYPEESILAVVGAGHKKEMLRLLK